MNTSIFGVDKGIICHQVNCQNAIGGGLSGAIIKTFPIVEEKYRQLFTKFKGEDLFGKKTETKVTDTLTICNLFTQFDYNRTGQPGEVFTNVEYLINAVRDIADKHPTENVYIPYNIGCGLGGAKWEEVFEKIKALNKPNLYLIDTLNQKYMTFNEATVDTFGKKDEPTKETVDENPFRNLRFSEDELKLFKSNCLRFLCKDYSYKTCEINETEHIVRITGLKEDNGHQLDTYCCDHSFKEIYDKFKNMIEIPPRERYEPDEKLAGVKTLGEIVKDRNIVINNLDLVKDVMTSCEFKELVIMDSIKIQVLKNNKGLIMEDFKNNLKIRHTELMFNAVGDVFVERSLVDDFPTIMLCHGYKSWVKFFTDVCMEIDDKYKEIRKIKGLENENKEPEKALETEEIER